MSAKTQRREEERKTKANLAETQSKAKEERKLNCDQAVIDS
jgi:hypothetical protein